MKLLNRTEMLDVVEELEARIIDGGLITVDEISNEFFHPNSGNLSEIFIARGKARSILTSLKHRFNHGSGEWFGCLNPDGQYGLCTNSSEYRWVVNKYTKLARGVLNRTIQVYTEGHKKGMLPPPLRSGYMLPELVEEEGDKKDESLRTQHQHLEPQDSTTGSGQGSDDSRPVK